MNTHPTPVAVTGMGIVCSIAQSIPDFVQAIREGRCGITQLHTQSDRSVRIGALIREFSWPEAIGAMKSPKLHQRARKVLHNTTDSTRLSACAAIQACQEAQLGHLDGATDQMGLIVAGSNLAQAYMMENWSRFSESGRMNPRYALSFSDPNQVGCLSEILAIRGPGLTIGAAAASSNAALFQGFHWIRSGLVKRCLIVGASMEFSALELEAFALLGAACHGQFADDPDRACRPFDLAHEGFVWGQGSAAIVLESLDGNDHRPILAEIVGASLLLDGNHLPDPSVDGECRAMRAALESAGLEPDQIGYLSAHGSSSPLGDRTECAAIKSVFQDCLSDLWINSTKSLTGHCFSASGMIELVATVLQMNAQFVHPNRNLDNPIDLELKLVGRQSESLSEKHQYAMSNGFGFGGFNSTLVIKRSNS